MINKRLILILGLALIFTMVFSETVYAACTTTTCPTAARDTGSNDYLVSPSRFGCVNGCTGIDTGSWNWEGNGNIQDGWDTSWFGYDYCERDSCLSIRGTTYNDEWGSCWSSWCQNIGSRTQEDMYVDGHAVREFFLDGRDGTDTFVYYQQVCPFGYMCTGGACRTSCSSNNQCQEGAGYYC